MELRFKQQKFQEEAAHAVVDIFQGQPKQMEERPAFREVGQLAMPVIGNAEIALPHAELEKNLRAVQKRQDIPPEGNIGVLQGIQLTVEMETGTGKTYTYIKTMHELYKTYGWGKFIIVVPSVAIREGVKKTFEVTAEHFKDMYGNKVRAFIYDSQKLQRIKSFTEENGIHAMIINAQAFNATGKDARRIFMELDAFQSQQPMECIASMRPILIIDEPQSVEGAKTKERLKEFRPLFTLRYSATPKEKHALIYRLDAIDAYNQKLVKKISVKGIRMLGNRADGGYLYLEDFQTSPTEQPKVRIRFDKRRATRISQATQLLTEGADIYQLSGELEEYKTLGKITDIDAAAGIVRFLHGKTLQRFEATGDVGEREMRRLQIRETIYSHIERECMLYPLGIKVLSLFFIDEVAKYRVYEEGGLYHAGEYAELFEQEYQAIYQELLQDKTFGVKEKYEGVSYRDYLQVLSAAKTHAGYFSQDKKGHMMNSKIKRKETSADDVDAYDLIMKNKELLLDLNPEHSPVRFLFSHSALREGWDNPNVFQICTLKQANSEIRKRQEVERGMRLAVNQEGERMDEERLNADVQEINVLTVIASESYEDFTRALQKEIAEDVQRPLRVTPELIKKELNINDDEAGQLLIQLGKDDLLDAHGRLTDSSREAIETGDLHLSEQFANYKEPLIHCFKMIEDGNYKGIEDAGKRNAKVKINQKQFQSEEFQQLWKRIRKKSVYQVHFSERELIEACIKELDESLLVPPLAFAIQQGTMEHIEAKENLLKGESLSIATEQI